MAKRKLSVGQVYVCVNAFNDTMHFYEDGQRFKLLSHSKKGNKIHYFVELEMLDLVNAAKKILTLAFYMDNFMLERAYKINKLLEQESVDIIISAC